MNKFQKSSFGVSGQPKKKNTPMGISAANKKKEMAGRMGGNYQGHQTFPGYQPMPPMSHEERMRGMNKEEKERYKKKIRK